jgi:putative membrane protein
MKKSIKKIAVAALSMCMVIASSAGCGGKKAEEVAKNEIKIDSEKADMEKAEEMAAAEHSSTSGKNETVYVIKNGDGTSKTIVSEWLKNPSGAATMTDVANLDNIEVVKGDAEIKSNENGSITWDAKGADIYYRGNTTKSVPVDVEITYRLDGKAVKASELKGKSGHLAIEINYKNMMTKSVTGKDGKEYTIYMPFIMSTGMILDNAKFSNVTVTNGEAVNDGEHTVVMGIGFPGLYDSLGLDTINLSIDKEEKKIERSDIPESITIECDVNDCDELSVLSVGKVFDINKINKTYDVGNVDTDVDDMTDGMKKLLDGSNDLHSGIKKVDSGVKTLEKGAKKISDGAGSLAKGAKKLSTGSSTLASGAKSLNEGMATLNKSMPSADDAKKLAAGSKTINSTIDNMHSAIKNVPVSEKDIDAVTAKMYKLVKEGQLDEATMKQIVAVYKTYAGLEKGISGIDSGYSSINSAVQAYPKLVSAIGSASKGAKQVADGAQSVSKGAKELSSGADKLAKGAKNLSNGTGTLADGTEKLVKGSKDLKDGLKKFDDKAVNKIADMIHDTIDPLSDRFESIKAYAESYDSFTGADKAIECSTVFIFKNA